MWDGSPFNGTKIALLNAGAVLAYLRDDKDGIPWPGFWDLPGGGREGGESPIDCALREVEEEFGIRLPPDRVTTVHRYEAASAGASPSYFCVASITPAEIGQFEFGDEGQHWQMMEVREFIGRRDSVPHMQERLVRHLNDIGKAQVTGPAAGIIRIAAALIEDGEGRLLLVRKTGTRWFMQPGGKIDAGESALSALRRELREEIGLELAADAARYLGCFSAAAANEPGLHVAAELFHVRTSHCPVPCGEIEEAVWVTPAQAAAMPLAPLTRGEVLPLARAL